jgi:hypothetical protein
MVGSAVNGSNELLGVAELLYSINKRVDVAVVKELVVEVEYVVEVTQDIW